MTPEVANYKCPACEAPLRYDETTGRLHCEYGESTSAVQEVEAMMAAAEKKAVAAHQTAEAKEQAANQSPADDRGEWEQSSQNGTWDADEQTFHTDICPSCAAELICDAATAATSCPYCGNPTVIPGRDGGRKTEGLQQGKAVSAQTYSCGLYLLTPEDAETAYDGADAFDAAVSYYHANQLGFGADRDGLLLVLSM